MQQNRLISPNRPLASLLKRAHLLLLIVIGGSDPCSTDVGAVFHSGKYENRNHPRYGRRYQLTIRFPAPT